MRLAFFPILGQPLIFWTGLLAVILFGGTYLTGQLRHKGNRWAIRWHGRLAHATAIVAVFHGILGIMIHI